MYGLTSVIVLRIYVCTEAYNTGFPETYYQIQYIIPVKQKILISSNM